MSSTLANRNITAYHHQLRIRNLARKAERYESLNVHIDGELCQSRSELRNANQQLLAYVPLQKRCICERDSSFEDRTRINQLYVAEKNKNEVLLASVDKMNAEKEDAEFNCCGAQLRSEMNMQEVARIRNDYHAQAQRAAKILGPSKNKTFEECINQLEKTMASFRLPAESLEGEYIILDGKLIALGEEKKRVDEDLDNAIKQLGENEGEITALKGKIARDYQDMVDLQDSFSQLKLSSENKISALEAQLAHERAACQEQITLTCRAIVRSFAEANHILPPIFDGEEVQRAEEEEEEDVGEHEEAAGEGAESGFSGYAVIDPISKDILDAEASSTGEDRTANPPCVNVAVPTSPSVDVNAP